MEGEKERKREGEETEREKLRLGGCVVSSLVFRALSTLLQTHRERLHRQRHKGMVAAQEAAPRHSARRPRSLSPLSRSECPDGATPINGLLGRIDATLSRAEKVLESDAQPERLGNAFLGLGRVEYAHSTARGAGGSMHNQTQLSPRETFDELKRHVLDMSKDLARLTPRLARDNSSEPELPDLSPCSAQATFEASVTPGARLTKNRPARAEGEVMPNHTLNQSPENRTEFSTRRQNKEEASVNATPLTRESPKTVRLTANLEVVTAPPRNKPKSPLKTPLSLSVKPLKNPYESPSVGNAMEKAKDAIRLFSTSTAEAETVARAKETALRKARDDCDRLFKANVFASRSDAKILKTTEDFQDRSTDPENLLSSLRSRDCSEIQSARTTVIDALSPPKVEPDDAFRPGEPQWEVRGDYADSDENRPKRCDTSASANEISNSQTGRAQELQSNQRGPVGTERQTAPVYVPKTADQNTELETAQPSKTGKPIIINLGQSKRGPRSSAPPALLQDGSHAPVPWRIAETVVQQQHLVKEAQMLQQQQQQQKLQQPPRAPLRHVPLHVLTQQQPGKNPQSRHAPLNQHMKMPVQHSHQHQPNLFTPAGAMMMRNSLGFRLIPANENSNPQQWAQF